MGKIENQKKKIRDSPLAKKSGYLRKYAEPNEGGGIRYSRNGRDLL